MILLNSSWPELFVLTAFQSWGMSSDNSPSWESPAWKGSATKPMQDLFQLFKSHSLDQGEVACLKAICLFRPGKHINIFDSLTNVFFFRAKRPSKCVICRKCTRSGTSDAPTAYSSPKPKQSVQVIFFSKFYTKYEKDIYN